VTDVDLAEKIYGKDVASIKGKNSEAKTYTCIHNIVEIPKEWIKAQEHVDLCFDTVYINGLPFVSIISKRIKYRTMEWIPNRTMGTYIQALKNIIKIYSIAGFKVTTLSCDR
jgi:hypothetical protein